MHTTRETATTHDQLLTAIDAADVGAVRGFLQRSPELVHITDRCGFTPLMRAANSPLRSVDVITAILNAGADVDVQSSEGYTALHCAIDVESRTSSEAFAIISTLIAAGASLGTRQNYGWTPLLCAVIRGRVDEAKCLLVLGADPNELVPDDSVPAFNAGRTVLMAALTSLKSDAMLRPLLAAGADPLKLDAHGMNFFEYADKVKREPGEWCFSDAIERGEHIVCGWLRSPAAPAAPQGAGAAFDSR